ncbi:hypothetical protein C491_17484 [Natronococcus amylolyticus DSM 10524]|uniref:SnoaL-like domain-containing protein n=1 Tax=Natronococcus amylolyticus DSM 10524 TaxID=1227497 RepID=L9WZU4_9EURY|nr:nuclear transport factor 2 family protein [Natronococcus amylolyticus]ELY54912.1 hypothetical protein C491_17484 [Natronococcus amylolyticus DSM 10524]
MAETTPPDAQALLEKDAIKEAVYEFFYRGDEEGEWAGAIDQFATEDISFDAGEFGTADDRDGWRDWAETVWKENMAASWHMLHNPLIEVDGDEATGRWRVEEALVTTEGDAVWAQGTYDHEYRRVDGAWKCSSWTFTVSYLTPYEQGWAEQPFPEDSNEEPDW